MPAFSYQPPSIGKSGLIGFFRQFISSLCAICCFAKGFCKQRKSVTIMRMVILQQAFDLFLPRLESFL